MSIPNLPVNFKDDILAASNPKRKYQQTFNSDGSVSLEDVTVYSQTGSEFGASQVNQTNKAINNIYSERILDLDELELVTEPGFFVDAQAAKEAYDTLNSNIKNNAGIIAYMKYIALSFHTSDTLQTWLKDVPDDIFSNPGNYTVALAMRQQSGTPYGNVSKMTYEIRTDPLKQFVVNAYGAGFVSGHMLDVSVTIFKSLD